MIRSRFSPSPTGLLHIGSVRTALFSALYAKKADGVFLLRIEDTDATRSEERFTELLQDDLHWLDIHWQEGPGIEGTNGPYFQSQRQAIYDQYYQQLSDQKLAYPCFCTEQELTLNRKIQISRGQAPRYPGTCRELSPDEIQQRLAKGLKPALRFRVPQKAKIEFMDLIKGPQQFMSDDIGDFIIRRADHSASFMFCNAIDDSCMGVTHVIRGEDHLTNTPRQLMILNALKMRLPQYAHMSLITGDDGSPLSKRHGSFSSQDLRQQGYLPNAVLNYLARLGHTYEEQKLFSFHELADHFQLEKISRAPARFDLNQLLFWQKTAVMELDPVDAWKWLGHDIKSQIPEISQADYIDVVRANVCFPGEAQHWATIFFADQIKVEAEQEAIFKQAGEQFFLEAEIAVQKYGTDFKHILDHMKKTLSVSGKQLFMPIRVALTGEHNGPELVQIAKILGPEKMMERFRRAFEVVSGVVDVKDL